MGPSLVSNASVHALTVAPSSTFDQLSSLALKIKHSITPFFKQLLNHLPLIITGTTAAYMIYHSWHLRQTNYVPTLNDSFKEKKCRALLRNPNQIPTALTLFRTIKNPSSSLQYSILPHVIDDKRMVETICHRLSDYYYMLKASALLTTKYPEKASELKEKAFKTGLTEALNSPKNSKIDCLLSLARHFNSDPHKFEQIVKAASPLRGMSLAHKVANLCSLANLSAESQDNRFNMITQDILQDVLKIIPQESDVLAQSYSLRRLTHCYCKLNQKTHTDTINNLISSMHHKVFEETSLKAKDKALILINLAHSSFHMQSNALMRQQFNDARNILSSLNLEEISDLIQNLNLDSSDISTESYAQEAEQFLDTLGLNYKKKYADWQQQKLNEQDDRLNQIVTETSALRHGNLSSTINTATDDSKDLKEKERVAV